ncbi:MAG: type IV secretory system conjugative DNA transfer family protein [Candidatus Binataceae bacterium]
MLTLAVLTAATIIIVLYLLHGTFSGLHGSARWATTRDIRAAGLIAPHPYLPQPLRRLANRIRLFKPRGRRVGIYLGIWRGGWRSSYLRDCGPGHVLVFAPTRSGKGVGWVDP